MGQAGPGAILVRVVMVIFKHTTYVLARRIALRREFAGKKCTQERV